LAVLPSCLRVYDMASTRRSSIVADGRERVIAGELAEIKRKVRAKYAQEMAEAGFLRRLRLRWQIRSEIAWELNRIAPRRALYLRRVRRGGADHVVSASSSRRPHGRLSSSTVLSSWSMYLPPIPIKL